MPAQNPTFKLDSTTALLEKRVQKKNVSLFALQKRSSLNN